ncbi:MAG TPA: hypothetical protein DCL41_00445 [Bdellovibrionales bacterium]|nr:hypothetical protein [Pseudobdellovibrionaceae bacterium]HAG90305.1 hypothetical protein [Bdellovibrionales bacterium]|tara:strand:- start:1393 stop:1755 length:363 start_codon:yes stop_codon:yes gene_type:complete
MKVFKPYFLLLTVLLTSGAYSSTTLTCLNKIQKDAIDRYVGFCDENDPYYSYCVSFKNEDCSLGEIKAYDGDFSNSFQPPLTSVKITCGSPSDYSEAITWEYIADVNCKLSSQSLGSVGN